VSKPYVGAIIGDLDLGVWPTFKKLKPRSWYGVRGLVCFANTSLLFYYY